MYKKSPPCLRRRRHTNSDMKKGGDQLGVGAARALGSVQTVQITSKDGMKCNFSDLEGRIQATKKSSGLYPLNTPHHYNLPPLTQPL